MVSTMTSTWHRRHGHHTLNEVDDLNEANIRTFRMCVNGVPATSLLDDMSERNNSPRTSVRGFLSNVLHTSQ